MENPVSALTGQGHTVMKAVVFTLVTIAVIKYVASNYPNVPVIPTIAAHV